MHRCLKQQTVFFNKILAGVRDDLGVGRVVYRFNADDFVTQVFVMGVDVFDELQLGIRWADNQNLARTFKRFGNLVVILLVFKRFARARFAAFDVQVFVCISGANGLFFDLFWAKVHHMCFGMVKPDNGVVVRHRITFLGDKLQA